MSDSKAGQIFITGCGRSGTSMVAGLFRNSGCMGDALHPARESISLGFFESLGICRLNEQILLPCLPKSYHHGQITYGADAPGRTHTCVALKKAI